MRAVAIFLAGWLSLSACQPTATPTTATPTAAAPASDWSSGDTADPAATREQRLDRWEREWQEAKRVVATTREAVAASGATIPPEVDREVTDLLNRSVPDDQGDETRIEDLRDAVSDALRLAEILSIG